MDAATARRKTSPEEPVHGCHQGWDTASSNHVEDSQSPLEVLAGFPESMGTHTFSWLQREVGATQSKTCWYTNRSMGHSLRNCPSTWLWVYSPPYHLALQLPIPEARECLSLGLQGPSSGHFGCSLTAMERAGGRTLALVMSSTAHLLL